MGRKNEARKKRMGEPRMKKKKGRKNRFSGFFIYLSTFRFRGRCMHDWRVICLHVARRSYAASRRRFLCFSAARWEIRTLKFINLC